MRQLPLKAIQSNIFYKLKIMKRIKLLHTLALALGISLSVNAQVGIGTATPNASSALEISSTSQGFLLPRMTAAQQNAIANPAQGLMVYCTNCGTNGEAQLYNGASWVNLQGGTATPGIGSSYGGGIVAYIFVSGDPGYVAGQVHGLIAAPTDQSTNAPWGCSGTSISTSASLGTGNTNTVSIVAGCSTSGIAAKLCSDLVINNTYNDWYLPSQAELGILSTNRVSIGNFNSIYYWSSTQSNTNYAKRIRIDSGAFSDIGKTQQTAMGTRAVRTF